MGRIKNKNDANSYAVTDIIGMLIGPEAGLAVYILISTYLLYFYTNVIGLNVAVCSTLILVSKVFDGVSDAIFGFILDRTRSQLGACRSWTLRVCIPYAIMTILLFTVPGNEGIAPYVYVFLTYNIMVSICYTIGDLSENTLPTYITRNAKGRGLLYTCKGLSAGITAYIVSNYTMVWVSMLGQDKKAWIKLAAIVALVSIITKCLMVALTKERVHMEEITEGTPTVKEILKAMVQNKYWIIVTIMLCAGASIQTGTASLASYYAQYVLGNPVLTGTILSAFLLPPILGFLIAGLLMQRFNKKPLVIAAVVIGFVGSALSVVFGSDNLNMLLAGLAARGFAYSIIMGVCNTMAADTVEYGHWKTGVRSQGVLMSGKGLGDKLASGLVTGIIGWIMGAAGYDGTLAVQPESAVKAINALFLYIPFILLIIIVICLCFYNLDKLYPKIMKELEEREAKLNHE